VYNQPCYSRQRDGNPSFQGGGSVVYSVQGTATLAQINAGLTVVAGVPGQQIKVIGGRVKANGAFEALTAIELQEEDGSPVIAGWSQATLTNGAVFDLRNTISGQTIGAGFMAALTAGKGLLLTKTGGTATTATSLDYIIDFVVV